jgi:lipopolysaccharide exporter
MITASIQLPVLLLNRFFEQAVVGRYFHAHKVLSLPLSLIGNSIAQVLFTQLTSLRNYTEAFSTLVYKTYDRLMTLGSFPFAIVGVFGPELFQFVFGEAWRESGIFASIISPWLLFNFAGSPLTIVFSAVEKQKQMFLWFTVMFALRIVSLFIGFIFLKDVQYSIILFSASGTLFYFGLNFYIVCHLAKVKIKDFLLSTFVKPSLILSAALALHFLLSLLYK